MTPRNYYSTFFNSYEGGHCDPLNRKLRENSEYLWFSQKTAELKIHRYLFLCQLLHHNNGTLVTCFSPLLSSRWSKLSLCKIRPTQAIVIVDKLCGFIQCDYFFFHTSMKKKKNSLHSLITRSILENEMKTRKKEVTRTCKLPKNNLGC